MAFVRSVLFLLMTLLAASPYGAAQQSILTPYGSYYSAPVEFQQPSTIEQLIKIVADARTNGKKISLAGSCLSQGKHV